MQLQTWDAMPQTFRQERCAHAEKRIPTARPNTFEHGRDTLPHRRRYQLDRFPKSRAPHMAVIASEDFVSPVARQADSDTLASQPRQQKRRNLRRIGERLIVDRRKKWNHLSCFRWRYTEFRVFRLQELSYGLGIRALVVFFFAQTDRKRFDRARTLGLHQSGYCRRGHSTREEHSQRHICCHPKLDGIAKQE